MAYQSMPAIISTQSSLNRVRKKFVHLSIVFLLLLSVCAQELQLAYPGRAGLAALHTDQVRNSPANVSQFMQAGFYKQDGPFT